MDVLERLSEQLQKGEHEAVAEHISDCARCREAHATFMALEHLLSERRDMVPRPSRIADAVLSRIEKRRRRAPAPFLVCLHRRAHV